MTPLVLEFLYKDNPPPHKLEPMSGTFLIVVYIVFHSHWENYKRRSFSLKAMFSENKWLRCFLIDKIIIELFKTKEGGLVINNILALIINCLYVIVPDGLMKVSANISFHFHSFGVCRLESIFGVRDMIPIPSQ